MMTIVMLRLCVTTAKKAAQAAAHSPPTVCPDLHGHNRRHDHTTTGHLKPFREDFFASQPAARGVYVGPQCPQSRRTPAYSSWSCHRRSMLKMNVRITRAKRFRFADRTAKRVCAVVMAAR